MKNIDYLIKNGIDIHTSLEIFGDIETYNETLEDFLGEVDKKKEHLKKYKESGDMANYAIYAHSLKSDAKYFGFVKLAELAYKHEMEGKNNNIYFVTENYDALIEETNQIITILKNYVSGKTEPENIEVKNEERVPEPTGNTSELAKAILVVDDSNVITNFISKIFKDTYTVLVAKDGKEATEIIEKNKTYKIMAMLLDLNMPNVNGFIVLEYFKQNDLFKRIPVSIITGSDSAEIDQKAFTYPIVDMLKKPFNERDVKSILEKTILYNFYLDE